MWDSIGLSILAFPWLSKGTTSSFLENPAESGPLRAGLTEASFQGRHGDVCAVINSTDCRLGLCEDGLDGGEVHCGLKRRDRGGSRHGQSYGLLRRGPVVSLHLFIYLFCKPAVRRETFHGAGFGILRILLFSTLFKHSELSRNAPHKGRGDSGWFR